MMRALSHQQARAAAVSRACAELGAFRSLASGSRDSNAGPDDAHKIDFGFQEVPVQDKQSLVGQVFSTVAPSYDVMNDLMSGGLHRVWKDRLVDVLSPFPGMRHLDVAGGTGDVAFRVYEAVREAERLRDAAASSAAAGLQGSSVASTPDTAEGSGMDSSTTASSGPGGEAGQAASAQAERWMSGSVTVCDINADMLQQGEKKAVAKGIDEHSMQWVEGNAEALPFPDNAFDAYTVAFGIRNVTDRLQALREARRVLRPGGRFLCLEFSKITVPGLQQLYDLYSFSVIPELGRVVAGDAESYRYLVESIRMFPGQEEFAELVREAGFSSVRYENMTAGVVALHSGTAPRK